MFLFNWVALRMSLLHRISRHDVSFQLGCPQNVPAAQNIPYIMFPCPAECPCCRPAPPAVAAPLSRP
jgi:hypothetical protein